jgi:competence protein ComGC
MKKLNNKGISLVELVISMLLISIVMVFMYRLLININNLIYNPNYAVNNQQNRLEIIKSVQTDLMQHELANITNNNTYIKFTFSDGKTSTLTIKDYKTITYNSDYDSQKSWTMKNATINTQIYLCKSPLSTDNSINNYSINIIVYNSNNENNSLKNTQGNTNNKLDDIEIVYQGKDFTSVSNSNTEYCNNRTVN